MNFSTKTSMKYLPVAQKEAADKDAKLEFNMSGKCAYLLAPVSDEMLNELADYTRDLRNGFGFSGNLNIYTGLHSSLGVTYGLTTFDNSIYNIDELGITSLSNTNRQNFYGFNYQFSTLRKKRFICDFSIAPGIVTIKNDSTVNNLSFKYEARTFGLKISNRYNLMANENIGFFLELALFVGSIRKYEFEGQRFEFEDPKNLSRIEVGIGIKFIAD